MTKRMKKITKCVFGVLAGVLFAFGGLVSRPQVQASAEQTAYSVATPRASEIDITSEIKFSHQGQYAAGTETYLIRTTGNYWTKAPKGGCLNEHDVDGLSPVGGQIQMKYIYFNGKSLYDINREDDGSYGSAQGNIAGGGLYAPILVTMGSDNGQYSYIQIHVPTGYPTQGQTAEVNHQSFEIKAGFFVTENGVTYKVTKDLKFVQVNGKWTSADSLFGAESVTIGNPRVEGVANELYKVDIVSNKWNITCNFYDFMYSGQYAEYRKHFFINGVSVYDINEKTDDSGYVYSSFPMTGADDAIFAKPVLVETHAQNNGDPTKITLWIHKNYVQALDGEIMVTLGKGYSAFTGELTLSQDVSYLLTMPISVFDGTDTYTKYVVKGSKLSDLPTPSKPADSLGVYTFEGWYDVATGVKLNGDTVLTEGMAIESRFKNTAKVVETSVKAIVHHLRTAREDSWMVFSLSTNDYGLCPNTWKISGSTANDYSELLRIGFLDKVILKGTIQMRNGTTKTEATLMDVYNSYGVMEGPYLNLWQESGAFALRAPVGSGVEEIVIESGCAFPSYNYLSGVTTEDVRYMVTKTQTYRFDEISKSFNPQAGIKLDIRMADGASVRLTEDMTTSGIRFEGQIATADVEKLLLMVNSGAYRKVKLGMMIVPTDYLMGGQFTHEWLSSNGYEFIDLSYDLLALYRHFSKEVNGYSSFYGSIVDLYEENYSRNFSGLAYVMIDGEYVYANYNKANNSRSASFIANAAINDRNATKTGDYSQYISTNNNYSPYTEEENGFLVNYLVWSENSAIQSETLTALASKGGSQTITPTAQKLAGPYVELLYSTNINVWGEFTYTDGNKTAKEDFYLQAGTTNHKQYLDIFRKNGVGYGMNTDNLSMVSIKFTNAELANSSAPAGRVKMIAMYSQNKTIDTENQEIYLTVQQKGGGEITVGAHLGLGGALTYLAKSGIYEGVVGQSQNSSFNQNYLGYTKYKANTGSVVLSTDTSIYDENHATGNKTTESAYYGSATSSKPLDGAVNLINNVDAGRQIQQSWYANVGGDDKATAGENGYTRAYCYTQSAEGQYWPYNPVQAGDVVSNPSQIVDYEINTARGYIYVKARAMDWAKGYNPKKPCENAIEGGSTTKSYVENYYRLNEDGTLVVNNAYVDWNGFTDMELADWASTELPAVYPVQTLNYYVSNLDGDGTWTDGLEYNNGLGTWTSGDTACRQFSAMGQGYTKVEEWFAWANGDNGNAFALGMYIPNVGRFTSGRARTETSLSNSLNRDAKSDNVLSSKGLMSNMQPIEYTYQSAYVSNTSYTAPGIDFRMEAYKSIEYSYVICLGTVDSIRETFKEIKENGTITNSGNGNQKVGLDAWARADKAWTY